MLKARVIKRIRIPNDLLATYSNFEKITSVISHYSLQTQCMLYQYKNERANTNRQNYFL